MEDIILISSGEDSDVESKNGSVIQNEQSRYSTLLIDLTDSRWAPSQKRCRNRCRKPPTCFVPDLRECKPLRFMMDPCPAKATLEGKEKTPKYLMSLTEGSGLNYPCRSPTVALSAGNLSTPDHFNKITELCHNFPSEARGDGKTINQISDVSWKCLEKSPYYPASPSTISQWSSRSPSPISLSEAETAARPLTSGGHSSRFPTDPSAPLSPSRWHSSVRIRDTYTETMVEASDSQVPQMHELKQEDSLESGFPDYTSVPSPIGSYSPYYCPSVIDPVEFSDISSLYDEQPDEVRSPSPGLNHPHAEGLSHTQLPLSGTYEIGASGDGQLSSLGPSLEPCPVSPGTVPPKSSQAIGCLSPALADAPDDFGHTSTDVMARGSSDWLADGVELPVESSFSSLSLPRTPSFFPDPGEDWSPHCIDSCTRSCMQDECKVEMEAKTECEPGIDCHYVSPARLKRLRNPLWRSFQIQANKDDKGDEKKGEEVGCGEALCRRGLNLVNTTIEENFPEGTLQLLADFLHPRVWPPPQITKHLLRGILLNCQCPIALVSEAYTLLMRTQKYHPADCSSVPWDWELLCSVMNEQKPGWYKDPSKRHQSSVVRMLLQYVLQTLEDDFHLQLSQHSLFSSIASAMLSCDRRFSFVRDVIGWLVYAVKNSTGDPQRKASDTEEEMLKEQDENLKVVFLLQRMLNLALEVDRSPTCSSNKISQELFQTLISIVPLRQHRLLLLETLDSSLLRCKVLELLLHNSCLHKSNTPMSLKLLLHFFQNAMPTTDPMDGAMKCSSWNELVQLLWMLLLSYEEVKEGHLRVSITERARYTRPPIQTVNDQITRAAVQEAANGFHFQLSADLGASVPPQLENLFSSLLGYLLDACQ
nr:SUMO-interacting motif-containing protein 1 isoform X1 [Paramormyrops kingsleyae]